LNGDPQKARANLRKHGVSFEQATEAFRDPFGIEWLNEGLDHEERTILLGQTSTGILVVVHTDRSPDAETQRYRLISARRATRDEENFYYRENC
jgi:uncharacterized DUF497 family protein